MQTKLVWVRKKEVPEPQKSAGRDRLHQAYKAGQTQQHGWQFSLGFQPRILLPRSLGSLLQIPV